MTYVLFSILLITTGLLPRAAPAQVAPSSPQGAALEHLVRAYPAYLDRIDGNHLVWKDGTRMVVDDGRGPKPFEALLEAPDLKDMFYVPYPLGAAGPPGKNVDPGRVRHEDFFNKLYGDCRKRETEANLVDVVWLPRKWGKTLKITRINGVDEALRRVSAELDALPARFDEYLLPAAGTYNCRPIAGTKRQSVHGHGIAIDIALKHAHYWQWTKPAGDKVVWRNKIPPEIVEIFEKHGFIWGGRWYHYDTMHFEYRPELLPPR